MVRSSESATLSTPMVRTTIALLLALLTLPLAGAADADRPLPKRDVDSLQAGASLISSALLESSLSARTIHEHVVTLSSPFYEGRGTGTEGGLRAAEYIAFNFAEDGLDPLFDPGALPMGNGFYQLVPVEGDARLDSASVNIIAGDSQALELGAQFSPLGVSGTGSVRAPLVFVGYSVERGPQRYRSYSGDSDLKGRIALMLRYEPVNSKGKSIWAVGGRRWSTRASLTSKIEAAISRGASAVVIVNPPSADDPRADDLLSFEDSDYGETYDVPVVTIVPEIADHMLRIADPGGRSLAEFQKRANRETRHKPLFFDESIEIAINVRTSREMIETYNVGALLSGKGDLADQYVIIGGHYDHLGFGNLGGTRERTVGLLHPGADDNASGTAAVMLLADDLSERYSDAPEDANLRSVVFLAFTAEEIGLIGSRQFVREPPINLANAVGMLNFDMVGRMRDGEVWVAGLGTGEGLKELVEPILDASTLRFHTSDKGIGRSDHTNFHQAGLPVLHFYTGMHDDYHTPRDTAEHVNFEGVARIEEVVEAIAIQLATIASPPTFAWTGPSTWSPVRMGIAIDDDDPDRPGVIVASIDKNTAAAEAGLQPGDLITGLDGHVLTDSDELLEQLPHYRPGDQVTLRIEREGVESNLSLTLRSRFK